MVRDVLRDVVLLVAKVVVVLTVVGNVPALPKSVYLIVFVALDVLKLVE